MNQPNIPANEGTKLMNEVLPDSSAGEASESFGQPEAANELWIVEKHTGYCDSSGTPQMWIYVGVFRNKSLADIYVMESNPGGHFYRVNKYLIAAIHPFAHLIEKTSKSCGHNL